MRYDKWKWGTEPFKPNHMVYQALAVLPVLMIYFAIVVFAPGIFMLEQEPADTLTTPAHIKPEWYFLPAYQTLKMIPMNVLKIGERERVDEKTGEAVMDPETGKPVMEPIWIGFGAYAELLGVTIQILFLLAVILLPFLDRNPERHPRRRPVMMTIGAITALVVLALGVWGHFS